MVGAVALKGLEFKKSNPDFEPLYDTEFFVIKNSD